MIRCLVCLFNSPDKDIDPEDIADDEHPCEDPQHQKPELVA